MFPGGELRVCSSLCVCYFDDLVHGDLFGYCLARVNEKVNFAVDRVFIFGRISSRRDAGIAQLVEHNLAKVRVASSVSFPAPNLSDIEVAFLEQ